MDPIVPLEKTTILNYRSLFSIFIQMKYFNRFMYTICVLREYEEDSWVIIKNSVCFFPQIVSNIVATSVFFIYAYDHPYNSLSSIAKDL